MCRIGERDGNDVFCFVSFLILFKDGLILLWNIKKCSGDVLIYLFIHLANLWHYILAVLDWMKEHDSQGFGRTSDSSGVSDPNRPLPDQTGLRSLSDRLRNTFGFPASVSLGSLQPPVWCTKFLLYIIQIHIFLDLIFESLLELNSLIINILFFRSFLILWQLCPSI